ncbi:MAG TPA: (d)CMP kinase [Gemmatimonadales bacterium]|nr:(d)CMP kinase [Gemmatimonadales bacterium]
MSALRLLAIDGPAASGKSSTAAAVARALGWIHIDSGALYRVVTWFAVVRQLHAPEAILAAAEAGEVTLVRDGTTLEVRVRGREVESAIRSEAVTARVSEVAAIPAVRDWVNRRLRAAVREWGGGVMDGRDIGTAVFPDAPLKVFLTATPEARARRRLRQGGVEGDPAEVAAEAARLAERDRLDAGRAVAPLRQAPDARLLDTTDMAFEEQVAAILAWAGEAGFRP